MTSACSLGGAAGGWGDRIALACVEPAALRLPATRLRVSTGSSRVTSTPSPAIPHCAKRVLAEPAPDPTELVSQALAADLERCQMCRTATDLHQQRADYVGAHLRALERAGRSFAGEEIGFVEEVHSYFDVHIGKGEPQTTAGPGRQRPVDRPDGGAPHGRGSPAHRLGHCIEAFSSALRDPVRAEYPLPEHTENVVYQVVTDKPWLGFNYYLAITAQRVAVNAPPQATDVQPAATGGRRILIRVTTPSTAARGRVGQPERPGRADHFPGEHAAVPDRRAGRPGADAGDLAGWGAGPPSMDCGSTAQRAEGVSEASAALAGVRQDAALMLHDEHRDADEVADFLRRWLLVNDTRARGRPRFVLAAVARLHQHICRGIPAAARLAGRPPAPG